MSWVGASCLNLIKSDLKTCSRQRTSLQILCLLTVGCVSSSINNNKYLQYHTPCRKLKINMHKYICATTAVPLLRLGRSGSDPESGRKCSSTSYTDFRFYKVTRQHFKTISNNYISDDTVLQKYCMLCQRLQAVNELLLPFHVKCIHRVLVYSELFWHIAHNRLYLYQHITHCLITAVCF